MRKRLIVMGAALVAAGCATTEPGQGRGAAYVPKVDMEGVDSSVYSTDLASCRSMAQRMGTHVGENNDRLSNQIASNYRLGLLGAIIAAGASSAILEAANPEGNTERLQSRQKTAIVDCMAHKGYKNLDESVQVTSVASPKPAPELPQRKTGQDTYSAEKFAKATSCNASPRADLAEKGPGFEIYKVQCSEGKSLLIRCEFGNCAASADGARS